jgi:hypothetical protein
MVKGVERATFYFERPGPVNTQKTIELSKLRAQELNIDHIIVASLTGETALKVAETVKETNIKVICVTFRAGSVYDVKSLKSARHWREIPELADTLKEWLRKGLTSIQGPSQEMKRRLTSLGVAIVTSTDMAYNINASLSESFGIKTPVDVIERAFRFLICPGFKVCVFTTLTAADAGAIPVNREVISLGGVERGVDTALVIKPSYSDDLFHPKRGLEVREIICKPRTMLGPSGVYFERGL